MGREPQNDRHVIFPGQSCRFLVKSVHFRRIRWLQQRCVAHVGKVPVVLLVLGGICTRVITQNHHHPTDDVHETELNKGIGSHIQSHALEKYSRQMPIDGSTKRHFRCNLFIGRKFKIERPIFPGYGPDGCGNFRFCSRNH